MDQHQHIISPQQKFPELGCTEYKHVAPLRIQFSCEQNTKRGIKLLIKGVWKQSLERKNNVFIMDKICATNKPGHKLVHLNDVRLYLEVSRLSDISNEEGSEINDWSIYRLPAISHLKCTKRRKYLQCNMKF